MKKMTSMVMLSLSLLTTLPATAQFGKLLDKVKGGGGQKNLAVLPQFGSQNLIIKLPEKH